MVEICRKCLARWVCSGEVEAEGFECDKFHEEYEKEITSARYSGSAGEL